MRSFARFPGPDHSAFGVCWVAILLAVILARTPGPDALARGSDVSQVISEARRLRTDFAEEIEQLAVWCDQRGLAEQALRTRRLLPPSEPTKLYVTVMPQRVGREELADDAPPDVVEWDKQLARITSTHANALFALSRRAVRNGRASWAFDLVMAAVHANPDHEAIRRLLGFQKYRGQWRTRYEVRRLQSRQVWHDDFGWILKAHVPRYEQGERFCNGRWITAQQDAQLHQDIHHGWNVETEHYTIVTNHSLQAGVALGAELEQLYRVWKQLFIRFYATEAQVAGLFSGRAAKIELPRHAVVYFADRQDYVNALRSAFPNIEMSLGVYVDSTHKAYFFAGSEHDRRTLLHEATHQLFHESRPAAADVGGKNNFWIIEGIAMYMESLHHENGYHVLGGLDDARAHAARYRLLNDDFYVPLAEFTSWDARTIQSDPRIATLYSQAAGLTHFLIHYDHGRYRDALVAFLSAVYSGRANSETLARFTGVSYTELDRQYREFMEKER